MAYYLAKDWKEHDDVSIPEIAARLNSCASTVSYWVKSAEPPSRKPPRKVADKVRKRIAARREMVAETIAKKVTVVGTRYTPVRRCARTRESTRFPYGSTAKTARHLKREHPDMLISKSTVWRDLQSRGLKAYARPRGPRLTAQHMANRVAFARAWQRNKLLKLLAFSDEKWFDSDDGGRSWQWLPRHARPEARMTEQGGPKLMVWGVIGPGFRCLLRVPNEVMVNNDVYQKMIRPTLLELRKRGLIFQQDNAPGHTRTTKEGFFTKLRVQTLAGWPAHSPDRDPRLARGRARPLRRR